MSSALNYVFLNHKDTKEQKAHKVFLGASFCLCAFVVLFQGNKKVNRAYSLVQFANIRRLANLKFALLCS